MHLRPEGCVGFGKGFTVVAAKAAIRIPTNVQVYAARRRFAVRYKMRAELVNKIFDVLRGDPRNQRIAENIRPGSPPELVLYRLTNRPVFAEQLCEWYLAHPFSCTACVRADTLCSSVARR